MMCGFLKKNPFSGFGAASLVMKANPVNKALVKGITTPQRSLFDHSFKRDN